MQSQINLSPINQFVQQVRTAEFSHQKEIKISIQQARLISLALVEIMNELLDKKSNDPINTIVKINMDGGGFN